MKGRSGTFRVHIPKSLIGNGAIEQVGTVVKQLGGKKVLIVTDPHIVKSELMDKVKKPLGKEGIEYGIFSNCKPDALLSVIKSCAQFAAEGGYDLMIGMGGGSVMDTVKMASVAATAKDIAREDVRMYFQEHGGVPRRGLPMVQIATTSGSGSEWSDGAVVTDDITGAEEIKKVVPSDYFYPEVVIVDPLMTLSLPQKVTADTGLDALIHAIEAYINLRANPISDMFAEAAIRLIASNLRVAYCKGSMDVEARYNMSIAASLAIVAFRSGTGSILNHGLGHSLQSKVHTTHGESCSIFLPHVLEFNKLARLAELMGEKVNNLSLQDAARKAIDAVRSLSRDVGIPQRLRDIGVKKEDLPTVVDILFTVNPNAVSNNPRDCSRDDALRILEAAW